MFITVHLRGSALALLRGSSILVLPYLPWAGEGESNWVQAHLQFLDKKHVTWPLLTLRMLVFLLCTGKRVINICWSTSLLYIITQSPDLWKEERPFSVIATWLEFLLPHLTFSVYYLGLCQRPQSGVGISLFWVLTPQGTLLFTLYHKPTELWNSLLEELVYTSKMSWSRGRIVFVYNVF